MHIVVELSIDMRATVMMIVVIVVVMIAEVRVDDLLPLHLILRVLAVESDLRPLRVQLLLHDLEKVLGAVRVVPATQVDARTATPLV